MAAPPQTAGPRSGARGPEYLDWLGQQPQGDDTILMGATTYRLMSEFAADAETSAGEPTDEHAATGALADTPKTVFSSTLQDTLSWPNTELVSGVAIEAVTAMKRDGDHPMRTLGSLTLCRSLLEAGPVDRFRVVVFPAITAKTGQDCIYDGFPDVSLNMVASQTFDGRLQMLEYVPIVLDGPPNLPAASSPPTNVHAGSALLDRPVRDQRRRCSLCADQGFTMRDRNHGFATVSAARMWNPRPPRDACYERADQLAHCWTWITISGPRGLCSR